MWNSVGRLNKQAATSNGYGERAIVERHAFIERWLGLQVGAWALLVSIVGLSGLFQFGISPLNNFERLSERPFWLLLLLVAASVGMGCIQWLGLKRNLQNSGWWLPATVAGTIVGFGLAELFPQPPPGMILFLVYLFIAKFQVGVLVMAGRRNLFWIPVLGVGLFFSPYNLWFAGLLWRFNLLLSDIGMLGLMVFVYLMVGLPFALVTGLFLAWLLFPRSGRGSETPKQTTRQ